MFKRALRELKRRHDAGIELEWCRFVNGDDAIVDELCDCAVSVVQEWLPNGFVRHAEALGFVGETD